MEPQLVRHIAVNLVVVSAANDQLIEVILCKLKVENRDLQLVELIELFGFVSLLANHLPTAKQEAEPHFMADH